MGRRVHGQTALRAPIDMVTALAGLADGVSTGWTGRATQRAAFIGSHHFRVIDNIITATAARRRSIPAPANSWTPWRYLAVSRSEYH